MKRPWSTLRYYCKEDDLGRRHSTHGDDVQWIGYKISREAWKKETTWEIQA